MQVELRRYRWLFLIGFLAAVVIWCLRSDPAVRVMQERYERIRIGMTKAEVTQIMMGATELAEGNIFGPDWQVNDSEFDSRNTSDDRRQNVGWGNGDAQIDVGFYRDDKVSHKIMAIRIPAWKIKLGKWLQHLTAGGH